MNFHPKSPAGLGAEARAARRAALFRETPLQTLERWALGTAWALKPARIAGLPALGRVWLADLATNDRSLPHASRALDRPDGLCGIVHALDVQTLIEAHRRGLYPFAHLGPLKWWSPRERCVLAFGDFHMPRRLRSRLRQARYRVTFDRAFEQVVTACAEPRDGKWRLTWITPRIMQAYAELHDAGYAHSFEVWNGDDDLVGGGYGVAVGGTFTIESQFTREDHTSKIGFAVLNWHLAHWGFVLNDNKGPTKNCLDMGFRVIPRAAFLARNARAQLLPDKAGRWEVEADAATVAAWQPRPCAEACSSEDVDSAATSTSRVVNPAAAALVPAFDALDGSFALGNMLIAVL